MPWVFSNRAKRAWWSVHIKAWRKSGLSASAYWAPSRSDAQRLQDLAAFERVAARDDVTLATCWAHTRRKFYDVEQQTGSPIAAESLRRIAMLRSEEHTSELQSLIRNPYAVFCMKHIRTLIQPTSILYHL